MLGDKVIKSDSPLVSSKIDFGDFLSLIVHFVNMNNLGWEREWDEYEGGVDGEFQSVRCGEEWVFASEWVQVLFEILWNCYVLGVSVGVDKINWAIRWICEVWEVYWQVDWVESGLNVIVC